MIVKRISQLTKRPRAMEIPISPEALSAWHASGQYVQTFFPQLSAEEREFLITGITPDEWNQLVPRDDDGGYTVDGTEFEAPWEPDYSY